MATWFGSLTFQLKSKLENVVKNSSEDRTILLSTESMKAQCLKMALRILDDPSHILFIEYSGRGYRSYVNASRHLKLSFIPMSDMLFNIKYLKNLHLDLPLMQCF